MTRTRNQPELEAELPQPHPSDIVPAAMLLALGRRDPAFLDDFAEALAAMEEQARIVELRGPRLEPEMRVAIRQGSALGRWLCRHLRNHLEGRPARPKPLFER